MRARTTHPNGASTMNIFNTSPTQASTLLSASSDKQGGKKGQHYYGENPGSDQ